MSAPWPLDTYGIDADDIVRWPDGVQRVELPPLISFGYFTHSTYLPPSWYPPFGRWSPKFHAFEHIFQTGNIPPPPRFDTTPNSLAHLPDDNPPSPRTSLARWRAEKEFRACLVLHGITLWRDATGTHFSMKGTYECGYTAPNTSNLNDRPKIPEPKQGYTDGKGAMWPRELKPLFYGWGVHIKIDVGFRIDELLAKLGNRLLYWGRGVPFMRMTLDFDVHTGGAHRVEYNGSAIPTQMYQTDAETDMYDMVNDVGGYQDIETALSAGFEAKAPLRLKPVVKRT